MTGFLRKNSHAKLFPSIDKSSHVCDYTVTYCEEDYHVNKNHLGLFTRLPNGMAHNAKGMRWI